MASNGGKKRTQKAGQGESNVKKNRERERKRKADRKGMAERAKKCRKRKQSK
mgnify:CR=1 FL=1